MAYSLLDSESTVHVLSPTEILEAVRATVQTPVHNAILSSIVPGSIWGTDLGIQLLNRVAYNVDSLLSNTAAIAGVGTQAIDDNGLLQQQVTFTVAYTPPGSTFGQLTMQVDVPNSLLEAPGVAGQAGPGFAEAEALIAGAVAKLETMAAG